MKKKVLSVLLSAAMITGILAGCGGAAQEAAPAAEEAVEEVAEEAEAAEEAVEEVAEEAEEAVEEVAEEAEAAEEAVEEVAEEAVAADEGAKLNIQCWNEEFKTRLTDHYPGYEEVDATTGKIGDVEVKWTITPSDDNAYQNQLDTILPENENSSDPVDLFLVEADYALKYVNSDIEVTTPIADLGITEDELANQYQYTKDVVTDGNGVLRGVSWQGCPGVLIYNRAIATEVLGTDDPDAVQEYVKDWDTFNETAATLAAAGYKITSTVNDSYRVFSNNVTTPWVVDGKINIDENLKTWVEMSKAQVDAGQTTTNELWSDDWSQGFYPDGGVFAYFGPAWLINFSMHSEDEASIAAQGGWGATVGPQGFYWGGTWICAAKGTDNPTLVADIIRQLTTNEEIMTDIVKADSDFVNNKPAMEAAATDDSYAFAVLGGQNPLAMFCEGADAIDLSNMSNYDQGCNEEFQNAMKNYFDGSLDYDAAIDMFNKAVVEKYPELTY